PAGVQHSAHYPLRNRGTFCGSRAHADPASEWCLVLAALDGEVVAKSARGERIIAARDFFKGIMTTALRDDELLVEARLPLLPADTRCGFYEFSRRAGDFALAAALGLYRLDGGKIAQPRLALGGVEVNPRRIAQAEGTLEGAAPGKQTPPAPPSKGPGRRPPGGRTSPTARCSGVISPPPARAGRANGRGHESPHEKTPGDRTISRAAGGPATRHRTRPIRRRHQ